MNKLRKMCIAFMLLLSACSTGVPQSEATTAQLKDGAYESIANGRNGEIKLSVTIDEGKIESIDVLEHMETIGTADAALEIIPKRIIENQTLNVDTLTGSTMTSSAVINGVADAISQAGGDVEYFKTNYTPVKQEDSSVDVDIVVAGAGAAGLSAAYEAAKAGASVLVVEKQGMQGGSTALSGGQILGSCTRLQENEGYEDSDEDFADFLIDKGDGHVNEDKLVIAAEKSNESIEFLEELGVTFQPQLKSLHDTYNPPRGYDCKDIRSPGTGAGGKMTNALYKGCVDNGVKFEFETSATDILLDGDKVSGLVCTRKDGSTLTVNAKSTVLATGGYTNNEAMMDEYAPYSKAATTSVPKGNVGDGIVLAQKAGAKIVSGGGAVTLYLDMATGSGENSGLYVTSKGQRFIDEHAFWFERSKALLDLEETLMYWITDSSSDTKGIYGKLLENNKIYHATSTEELAQQLGMDASTLIATVTNYNQYCANGVDEEFGKDEQYLKAINVEDLYAIPYTSNNSGTFGGPVTNELAQVLGTNDTIIDGLYAAGELANGDMLWQEYPGSGTSISLCITYGRIAGQQAATHINFDNK